MELSKNIKLIIEQIPKNVNIVAATKYVQASDMKKLIKLGLKNFGENRTDAFLTKYDELKHENIHWHFIGHLQTNKAKEILPKIQVLHSLDSLKLAKLIEDVRENPLDCYIEVNMNEEPQKNGVSPENLLDFMEALKKFPKVHLIGFMMMATKEGTAQNKYEQFLNLRNLKDNINKEYLLSMGMSDDYKEAIKAGSTTIRLGRILWEMN